MAVEHNVGGTQNPCTHRTTARSAKDPNTWVCLYCGERVQCAEQMVIEDVGITRPDYWPSSPVPLPKPPERKR